MVELAPIATDIARTVVSGHLDGPAEEAVDRIAAADGLVVSTPVYKAAISGLFTSFVDVLDDDLVIATPVVLAATASSARHAMVVDAQMRPLFAFLRALHAFGRQSGSRPMIELDGAPLVTSTNVHGETVVGTDIRSTTAWSPAPHTL